ncbi:hypothetical protein [Desulfoluna spongiiphila]|uniref:hypothetical protein n=1 Tax=Desulfoluna spongiiphila TaxID=419481 RepID=UPI0012567CF6|nr:hypothetical protein [Desulfoluna spongiiphila]VVS91152.1 hypothetical protein DBB_7200 [Desulfoluna spongiiphila]
MATAEKQDVTLKTMCENLAAFAVDREDIKQLLATLPENDDVKTVTVEYELQLLKIISAGWAISVYMDGKKEKESLAEHFWLIIREFSKNLSETLHLTTGADVDYFETLKKRLNTYLAAMEKTGSGEATQAVGPEFARLCGSPDNAFVTLNGARIFHLTVTAVQEYVGSVKIVAESA